MRRSVGNSNRPPVVIQLPASPFQSAVLYALAAFAACWLVLRVLLASRLAGRVVDVPNARSLHAAPVPRFGGVGVLVPVLLALLAGGRVGWALLVLALAGISLADDFFSISARLRLCVHVAAAALLVFVVALPPELPLGILLVLCVVWMINLFNFMDGSDGLAGGMALWGFSFLGLAGFAANADAVALLALSVAAAALAFLTFNFPPARVFLGDVGSVPLGFLAAAIGIDGWLAGAWPLWLMPLVFAPFIVDATATLLRRMLARERFWEAHRSHYYQRLVRMGWGHRRTALAYYGAMIVSGMAAIFAWRQPEWRPAVLAIVPGLFVAAMIWIDRRWARMGMR